jgi:hypothetical protein
MGFLSDIGGIFNSLFVVGKIVVTLFLNKMFYSSIMNQLYHIEKKKEKGQ